MVDYTGDATVQSWVKGTPLEGMHVAEPAIRSDFLSNTTSSKKQEV